jgi:hypothetical protein
VGEWLCRGARSAIGAGAGGGGPAGVQGQATDLATQGHLTFPSRVDRREAGRQARPQCLRVCPRVRLRSGGRRPRLRCLCGELQAGNVPRWFTNPPKKHGTLLTCCARLGPTGVWAPEGLTDTSCPVPACTTQMPWLEAAHPVSRHAVARRGKSPGPPWLRTLDQPRWWPRAACTATLRTDGAGATAKYGLPML